MAICSGSNIWDNRMSFCSVLLESTVIKFWSVNKEIKSFSRKSKFEGEECLLLQDEHIIVLCFYFSCWLWNVFFVGHEKYFCLGEDRTICNSFKINTTSWVLHLTKNVRCFVLVVYFSYRPWYVLLFFLMAGMTGAGWCYRSGTLSTSRLIVR